MIILAPPPLFSTKNKKQRKKSSFPLSVKAVCKCDRVSTPTLFFLPYFCNKNSKEKKSSVLLLSIERQFQRNLTLLYLNQADTVIEPNQCLLY